MAQNIDTNPSGEKLVEKNPIALREEEILNFWKDKEIFKKTLEKESPLGDFIFFEGPPTANGRPGIHHLEARAFKDIIPRYKTMRGFRVNRKAGWDTHGLPVELEVEKKLGLKSKKEIETYGIEKFNDECKKSVWTYVDEWRDFTNRIGYWIDLDHPYVTYKPEYIESVWNIVKQVADKDLLYKDYKVLPWCPRCGTALSSHELAQGYQDDKDLSVYAKFKVKEQDNTYILAWTTTPWTLPGNVALAVGKDVEYVEIKLTAVATVNSPEKHGNYNVSDSSKFILSKNKLSLIEGEYEIVREMKGSELVGLEYEPLYPYLRDALPEKQKEQLERSFKVYPADFVTTEDGTGIVHTAVMYGQDDFELGTKENLPKFHIVDDSGHFTKDVGDFAGRFVKDEEVAIDIIKDLAHRGLLFKKEKFEHSYPHCWRCKTPLIYYARDSWYIRMSSLRSELLAENEKINWEPSYIKEGRFGEWLREIKDWAISRERYWGTPLPVWVSEDGDRLIVDSVDTLKKYSKKSGNRYIIVRHGESEKNVRNVSNSTNDQPSPLTEAGMTKAKAVGGALKEYKPDLVFSSPLLRAQQTAKLIAEQIGYPEEKIVTDDRIREILTGEFNGGPINEYQSFYSSIEERFSKRPKEGENLTDVKCRMGNFIYELDNTYKDKTIVIVSHEDALWMLEGAAVALDPKGCINKWGDRDAFIDMGEMREIEFAQLPHNQYFELDLHRPYVDDVVLVKDGKEYRRIKEVMDVWFDSGAMPYAQVHYPFEEDGKIPFPADYISEAIDQTRGWFYTLHAIGVLTGRGHAYNNVMCLGHLLDKDGKKMSKSLGNVLNPWDTIDTFGVDPLRFWMYTINQPGESKNFDPKTVDEIVKKVFNLVLNVAKFYEPYHAERQVPGHVSTNVLDTWILALLDDTVLRMTKYLDDFKILEAARLIRDFIGDLSQWYLRRSRDRFKGDDEADKQMAVDTLGFVLERLSIVMAPFMPFLAEDIYQKVRTASSCESVHLAPWPELIAESVGEIMSLTYMAEIRRLVSLGLDARTKAGIKVRQPLSLLTLKSDSLRPHHEYLAVLMDEVNVKNISFDTEMAEEVLLDTEIDEALKREGEARELIRAIQDMRKEKGLSVADRITVKIGVTPWGRLVIDDFKDEITTTCSIDELDLHDLGEIAEPWFTISF